MLTSRATTAALVTIYLIIALAMGLMAWWSLMIIGWSNLAWFDRWVVVPALIGTGIVCVWVAWWVWAE